METTQRNKPAGRLTRRQFLTGVAAGTGVVAAGAYTWSRFSVPPASGPPVFIAKAAAYGGPLRTILLGGLAEIGVTGQQIAGKRILLKPNLVEPHASAAHINTHPAVVAAAIGAFKSLGAAEVRVAEGSGHRMDSELILEMTGYADMLREEKTRFADLNRADVVLVRNAGTHTGMSHFVLPRDLLQTDIIVSMAKMKTHHWVGATLSMKNLFGLMPGAFYGWPKNVLHSAGIVESILDIHATVRPQLAIVDGIVGMEGDGPIMGEAVAAGVIVMGRHLPAVDATCARIMGIDPEKMPYLAAAAISEGPIGAGDIDQRGEAIASVQRAFALLEMIPAHRGIGLPAAASAAPRAGRT